MDTIQKRVETLTLTLLTLNISHKHSYLHEISPKEWRGAIVSVNEACISLGFVISYLSGYLISMALPDDGWRYMFGLGVIIAVIQFCGMLYMPESPIWLKTQGRFREATIVNLRIHGNNLSCGQEIEEPNHSVGDGYMPENGILSSSKHYLTIDSKQSDDTHTHSDVERRSGQENIFLRFYYRQMIIAIFMAVMQQFCGNPTVLNFAPEIFAQLGFDSKEETLIITVLLGAMKCAITCSVIWKIEQIGRRKLLLSGLSIMAFSLFLLTIAYISGDMTTATKLIATLAVFGVAGGFSFSFGPLTWLLVSELFPAEIRGRALGASTIITYMAGSLVSYTFLTVQSISGPSVPFGIYFILTSLSIVFSYLAIPDTGNKDPGTIAKEIENMIFWRNEKEIPASFTQLDEGVEIQ